MIEPVGRVMKRLDFARLDVDRVERHRQTGRPAPLHHRPFAGRIVRAQSGRRARRRREVGPLTAFNVAGGEQCLIGVDCKSRPTEQFTGDRRDLAGGARVKLGGKHGTIPCVEHLPGFPAHNHITSTAFTFFPGGQET